MNRIQNIFLPMSALVFWGAIGCVVGDRLGEAVLLTLIGLVLRVGPTLRG